RTSCCVLTSAAYQGRCEKRVLPSPKRTAPPIPSAIAIKNGEVYWLTKNLKQLQRRAPGDVDATVLASEQKRPCEADARRRCRLLVHGRWDHQADFHRRSRYADCAR